VLGVKEPTASRPRTKEWSHELTDVLATILVRDGTTRLVFLNLVVWGSGALVMFWVNHNERISSAFRATMISLAELGVRASFCLLGPMVGNGVDAWGLPFVLSALGVLFSIVFIALLLPLVLRDRPAMARPALGLRAGG
jgi:hypothetical protein